MRPGTTYAAALFGSPLNAFLTIGSAAALLWAGIAALRWAVLDSSLVAGGPEPCVVASGACWSVIAARYRLILFGLYPYEEQWRSVAGCVVVLALSVATCVPALWTARRLLTLWTLGFTSFVVLMQGGVAGLAPVPTDRWGGLALTLFVYVTTIVVGMPAAVMLAWLRRAEHPALRWAAVGVIDGVRSVPLVAVVFAAAILAPFLLPGWLNGDKVYRVILGFALFFAAYEATILDAGMQAVGPGQREAGLALGLPRWRIFWFIVMPQAFRLTLPASVVQVVGTFKDTSVLAIVGLFELMASANVAYQTGEWSEYYKEVYVFVGLIYFGFSYALSMYGAFLERRSRVGLH